MLDTLNELVSGLDVHLHILLADINISHQIPVRIPVIVTTSLRAIKVERRKSESAKDKGENILKKQSKKVGTFRNNPYICRINDFAYEQRRVSL